MHTKIEHDEVRRRWSAEGFSCEIWVDPPEQIWHDFQHDEEKLVFLLEGRAQIEMGNRAVRMQAGDELLIPCGTRHTVRNCGEGPARWLHGYRAQSHANPA